MKSRVLIGRPLSLWVGSVRRRLVGRRLRNRFGDRLRDRRGRLGVADGHHRRPQDPVAATETLAQHGRRGRDADLRRRVVDDRLVQRGVERVARHAEGGDPETVEQSEDPVGHDLEGAGEVTVVPGPLYVVDDREELQREPLGGLVDDQRAVAVDPAPVVGVLGADPLQVLGPLGQLLLQVAAVGGRDLGGRDRGGRRLLGDRRLVLAHLFLSDRAVGGGLGRARVGGGGAGRLVAGRHPDRPADGVDAPLVADHDPRRILVPRRHGRLSVSSSTISASTTSSSAEPVGCPASPASAPGAPSVPASAFCAYSAPPTSWDTRATFSCAVLMASMSEPPSAERRSVNASPSSSFFSAGILSPFSARNFSVWYCSDSARLRVSASSRRRLSSSACASASFIIRSMSSLGRAEPPVMVIDCSLPVPRSLAWTWTMPFASMSNVTSICGRPRGAGGIPTRSNWPRSLLFAAISRSPWKTRMVTAFWLSWAVEKVWLFLV